MRQALSWIAMVGLGVAGLGACSRAGEELILDERTMLSEKRIGIAQVPDAARAAIAKAEKEHGGTLREVMMKTSRDGTRFYEAELALPTGGERDLLFAADGRPAQVENEKTPGDTPSSSDPWHKYFDLEHRTFSSRGRNRYMILEPGYQLTLEGKEGGKGEDQVKLVLTVLNETRQIGNVETRIVEEREWVNGELVEVARNYFAFCEGTRSIFYFGEDVDMYKGGKIDNHQGTWIAGEKAWPGMQMPAEPLLGARYYQEIAPGLAMDRAEIKEVREDVNTPSGDFEYCLTVEESNPLEPGHKKEYKKYAPGIGLVYDNGLLLTKHGFVE